MLRDLRYAARGLLRSPGFTAVAILTLAVGIGTNTAGGASRVAILSDRLWRPRLYAVITGVFGSVALGLAVIGIFGVVSYAAAQRTREIGVRMALGAQRREVPRLVLWEGMRPVAVGILAGVLVAVGLTRFIRTLLFGIAPSDPATFVAAALLLAGVCLIAGWIPAHRATRVDPLEALRAE